jgi:hypothetical protein
MLECTVKGVIAQPQCHPNSKCASSPIIGGIIYNEPINGSGCSPRHRRDNLALLVPSGHMRILVHERSANPLRS